MDKTEDAVAFILAVLVAMAPLSMLAESLWRRREKGRYIVEIWNGNHTRLLTTITATIDNELPENGETIVNLQERPGVASEDSPETGRENSGTHVRVRINVAQL